MPANFDTGFFVRQPAWHGLGNVVDEYPGSWDEARKIAGLDWEPIAVPSYGFRGVTVDGGVAYAPGEGVVGDYFTDEKVDRVIRSDTGKLLAHKPEGRSLVTNAELGEVVEALLDSNPHVKYETAGSLEDGGKVWALVRLDEPRQVKGDHSLILPYLAVRNDHTGKGALAGEFTSVRIVCGNTWRASESEGETHGLAFSYRHTAASWRDRIEEARASLNGLRANIDKQVEFFNELTGVAINADQREVFIHLFVPEPAANIISTRVRSNIDNARRELRLILDGPTSEGVKGSAYGLVQAAGEYLDHVRRYRNRETYTKRTLLSPEPLKRRAVELALEASKA